MSIHAESPVVITSEAERLQRQDTPPDVTVAEVMAGGQVSIGPVAYTPAPVADPLPAYTPAAGEAAVLALTDHLEQLVDLAEQIDRDSLHAGRLWAESEQAVPFVIAAERLDEVRRKLAQVAATLTRMAGQARVPHKGTLPDGRPYAIVRGADRKAWQHGAWQDDVRREVTKGVGPCVDTDTGEPVDVRALVASAQAVHGAGAPKVTSLKQLGLDPGDYCETIRGAWRIDLS